MQIAATEESEFKMNAEIDISGVKLTTQRLILRPFNEGDLNDFYEYARVDGVGQAAGWLPHENIEKSKEILSIFIEEKRCFALEHQGRVIGSLGIEKYSEENHPELKELLGCELGYVLSKDYWGQGLMTEAVRAVIKYLFETVKVDFITVGHFLSNDRSRRVIEKCGFRYVNTYDHKTRYGTVEKTMGYILFRQDAKHEIDHYMSG